MKYLVSSLIILNVFFVIVMGVYDRTYQNNLNEVKEEVSNLKSELKTYHEEEVKTFLEKYLGMEIMNIEEQFKNDTYACYTYLVNAEIQTVVLDNNNNLVALNPESLEEYQ